MNTSEGVKAFHNACRHRGVRLAHGPGHLSEVGFECPFHGWRFNAEGDCTFVFGRKIFSEERLNPSDIALAPVRVEFWAACLY